MKRKGSLFAAALVTALAPAARADEPPALPAPAPVESAPAETPRPVTVTYTLPAPAAEADRPAATPPGRGRPRYDLWKIGIGARYDYVATSGFDTFADSDVLSSFSLDATYPLVARERLTLGVGLGYTVGGRGDSLRGMTTSLLVHRMQIPIEARYHVAPQLFAFAKVAPGAAALVAEVKESSSPNAMNDTAWAIGADASVGAGILLGPRNYVAEGGAGPTSERERRTLRVWAIPELGYGFTTRPGLELRPDRDANDAIGADERVKVGGLSLSSFFWRLSIAATF